MSHIDIAIIIPAYKPDYLGKTLQSLADQTDKGFRLYIGDDNSPSDLLSIINPFKSKLDITYVRFEENLGGKNLVAHWNRCLAMMNDENYFILFSDDDEMQPTCIEQLKKIVESYDEDVLHFNLQIIDKDSYPLGIPTKYKEILSSTKFFKDLIINDLLARMPEFVFKTKHFQDSGGFVPFDDAIRSDNATVIQCAFSRGIRTIDGPLVLWRDSGINISSALGPATIKRYQTFFSTSVAFFNWMIDLCRRNERSFPLSEVESFDYLYSYGHNMEYVLGTEKKWEILKTYEKYPKGLLGLKLWFKLIAFKTKRKLKGR